MLPHRPRVGRAAFFSARSKVSRQRMLGSALGLAAPLLLLTQLLTSCGSDEGGDGACVPNKAEACSGAGQCMGVQICADDGKSFSPCDCGGGTGAGGGSGTGGSGAGGSGGGAMSTAGSSGMPADRAPFPRGVGAPCSSDAECPGAPLVCVGVTSSGLLGPGGPANGYCSLPCAGDADCTAVDDIAVCNRATGYCYGACLPGNSQAKCRAAQACLSVADDDSFGVCLPRCGSDAECGPNRYCDPSVSGTCLSAPPVGGKVGDPCTVLNQATDCASGFCIQYANGAGTGCGAFCTLGLLNGCGFNSTAGGVRQAFCFEPIAATGGVLDLGMCFPLCDTTADCAQAAAGWVCEPFTVPDQITQLGRQGECIPATLSRSGGGDAGVADSGN